MSELISKQAVLNTLDNMDKALDEERAVEKYKELLTECIKVLPSADVRENIHGEWIKNFLGIDICSKCGEPMRDRRVNHINFCNCCGADMRGKANEQT